jgi:hypothetical protein
MVSSCVNWRICAADLRKDGLVGDRYRAAGGWSVEVVCLTATPDHHDGEWIRVRFCGFHVADVRSAAELERWFPLASLEPETLALAA